MIGSIKYKLQEVLPITLHVLQKRYFCKAPFLFDMPAIQGGTEQKLVLKDVQGDLFLQW